MPTANAKRCSKWRAFAEPMKHLIEPRHTHLPAQNHSHKEPDSRMIDRPTKLDSNQTRYDIGSGPRNSEMNFKSLAPCKLTPRKAKAKQKQNT